MAGARTAPPLLFVPSMGEVVPMQMKFLGSVAVAAVLALAFVTRAEAITISVTPALAPNYFGSPSWGGWEANAVTGELSGGVPTGTPGTPTYFQPQSMVTLKETIVTGFPSWLGQADPGTVFGSGFANELGNRMTFALQIDGQGTQFSISQLGLNAVSSDPGHLLNFGFAAGGYDYGSGYVGVDKGPDGKLWTADDIYITSGLNTQLVDGLVGRGSGNSLDAYCTSCTIAEQQAAIGAAVTQITSPFTFTATYTLDLGSDDAVSGSGTFDVFASPLPAALPLFGSVIGGCGLVAWGRRHKKKRASTRCAA